MQTLYTRTANRFAAASEETVIETAQRLISARFHPRARILSNPGLVRTFLRVQLGSRKTQEFAVLLLSSRYRLLRYEILFHGTLDTVKVYPRELLREALAANARHAIVARNDPEGNSEPRGEDQRLAHTLREALAMIDVSLRDYFVVGAKVVSLAELGLM